MEHIHSVNENYYPHKCVCMQVYVHILTCERLTQDLTLLLAKKKKKRYNLFPKRNCFFCIFFYFEIYLCLNKIFYIENKEKGIITDKHSWKNKTIVWIIIF